jgi:simple sugar transport system ATP-binding protein
MYAPTSGEILIDGQPVVFTGPGDAMAAGIGMVHQHFMLVPVFTVAENVILGHEPTGGAFQMINRKQAKQLVTDISDRFGFDVDPDALIDDLPVGVQQRVEIIKALSRDAKVLILDEPTAVLTPQETDELIGIMRQLKASGTSIIFITHKLREVRAVADRITVIRRGKIVGEANPASTETELASLMVGRSVSLDIDKDPSQPDSARVFAVDQMTVLDANDKPAVDDVSFSVEGGEILALAGVQGNGQTELIEAIMGLQQMQAGTVQLNFDGEETHLEKLGTKQILRSGVGYVPEDRSTDGLIGSFTLEENFILDLFDQEPYSTKGVLHSKVIVDNAEHRVEEFDVRTQSTTATASQLSGGNQQKVVLAREMSRPLRLLICCQPTRGLDVGSIEFVHKRIVAERDKGAAVLVVSTELDEVLGLGDRIAVMYRGKIVGIVPANTSRDVLGLMMAGVPMEEAFADAKGNN